MNRSSRWRKVAEHDRKRLLESIQLFTGQPRAVQHFSHTLPQLLLASKPVHPDRTLFIHQIFVKPSGYQAQARFSHRDANLKRRCGYPTPNNYLSPTKNERERGKSCAILPRSGSALESNITTMDHIFNTPQFWVLSARIHFIHARIISSVLGCPKGQLTSF
ncbi:hypothetical protein BDV19DRAFT_321443 [Aspergillus venezuelensis]